MDIYGSRLMCTGLLLLRAAAHDGTKIYKAKDNSGVSREFWTTLFANCGFRPLSAPHAINDLVRCGLAIKSDDGKMFYVTEYGFYYAGRLEQIRPPHQENHRR